MSWWTWCLGVSVVADGAVERVAVGSFLSLCLSSGNSSSGRLKQTKVHRQTKVRTQIALCLSLHWTPNHIRLGSGMESQAELVTNKRPAEADIDAAATKRIATNETASAAAAAAVPKATATQFVAVVTGSTRGLGFEFVRQLSLQHSSGVIIACARTVTPGDALHKLASEHSNIRIVQLDVNKPHSVSEGAAAIREHTEHINLLINNAGIASSNHPNDPSLYTSINDVTEVFATNVIGTMLVTQQLIALIQSAAAAAGVAKVINISSTLGSIDMNRGGRGGMCAYRISKSGLNSLTKTFAEDVRDVVFIAQSPGWCHTVRKGNAAAVLLCCCDDKSYCCYGD